MERNLSLFKLLSLLFFLMALGCTQGFEVEKRFSLPAPSDGSGTPSPTPEPEEPTPPPVTPPPEEEPEPEPEDPPGEPEPPPPTSVPVFVSSGHMRSTMYTCDGLSWRGYRSADNNLRCWQPSSSNYDCDHSPYRSLGIAYGNGGFMATYGWGYPGSVELTSNGTSWTQVHTGSAWAGVAYGNSTYVLNEWNPLYSTNAGTNWTQGSQINFQANNPRRISFANVGPGVFITQSQSGNSDLLISTNNGQSFTHPTTRPSSSCIVGTVAHNASAILLLSNSALCRSTDNGQTWQTVGSKPDGDILIHDGPEFKAYSQGKVQRSTNGTTWTTTTLQLNGSNNTSLSFAHVSYHAGMNKYVAIYQGWDRYYEHTRYYHSDNGINWIEINRNSGLVPLTPHPVAQIAPGYLPASACQ